MSCVILKCPPPMIAWCSTGPSPLRLYHHRSYHQPGVDYPSRFPCKSQTLATEFLTSQQFLSTQTTFIATLPFNKEDSQVPAGLRRKDAHMDSSSGGQKFAPLNRPGANLGHPSQSQPKTAKRHSGKKRAENVLR